MVPEKIGSGHVHAAQHIEHVPGDTVVKLNTQPLRRAVDYGRAFRLFGQFVGQIFYSRVHVADYGRALFCLPGNLPKEGNFSLYVFVGFHFDHHGRNVVVGQNAEQPFVHALVDYH